jgi:hypothetical protein
MKTFINRLRWLNAGFILGAWFIAWAWAEEDKKKKEFNETGWAGNNPSKMDDIFNHYKEKENA